MNETKLTRGTVDIKNKTTPFALLGIQLGIVHYLTEELAGAKVL